MILKQFKSTSDTRFLKNFILSLKRSKKILTFISILHLLGLPVLAAILIFEEKTNYTFAADIPEAFAIISMFCLGAAVLCGIFIAMSNFRYLYTKSDVDMVYSLPIKKKTKFFSDFLSGAAVYLVPYAAACIIANLIILVGNPFPDEHRSIFPLIFQGEFAGLLVMLMLYTLCVFVMCCCGTLFESIMNIFLINAAIPGAIAVAALLFFSNLYGVPVFDTVLPLLGYTSPAGSAIYMYTALEYQNYYNQTYLCIDFAVYGKWVLFFMLSTAVYFLLSVFLYIKRKAEDTSKPYVFKFYYYIIITIVTMGISTIVRLDDDLIIPVIIFTLIIYMIFEIITNRGFKKIYKSFIKYAITMIGILVISLTAYATKGFGVEGKIYSPSLISSVEVSYEGIDSHMDPTGYEYWNYFNPYNKYKDKGIIQTILNVQKQAIDIYRSEKYPTNFNDFGDYSVTYERRENLIDDWYDFPVYGISFKFHLKTGNTVTRNYYLNYEQLKQLSILDSTKELSDYREKYIMECLIFREFEDRNYYRLSYSLLKHVYDKMPDIELSEDEAKEFARCYKQDYMETSFEEFTSSKVLCYLSNEIPIRECFERTVTFIKNKGGLKPISDAPLYTTEEEGRLYQPKGYKSWGRDDITASFGLSKTLNGYSHRLTASQTSELLKYAQNYYMEEADCYVMEIDGYYYVIPYKYSSIAEKIYNDNQRPITAYTFENLVSDIKNSSSPDDYISKHLDNNYDFYNDIQQIYDLIQNYEEWEFDDNTYYRDSYNLLEKFFGFYSYDEYIDYMIDKGYSESNIDDYYEWSDYAERFLQISDGRPDFFEHVH